MVVQKEYKRRYDNMVRVIRCELSRKLGFKHSDTTHEDEPIEVKKEMHNIDGR